jgi:DNA (cytosine-5)-methyltransferase 1
MTWWLLPVPAACDHTAADGPCPGGHRLPSGLGQAGLPALTGPCILAGRRPGGGGRGRLLPTPETGMSPNGHGRRGGQPGNGHQSGSSLDAVARTVTSRSPGQHVRWGEYEPAIRRWELILARPAPPPAGPGPAGQPLLAAAFTEWVMGLPAGWVTGLPGIPRTYALRILGNGVVPPQGACALHLLIAVTACPAPPAMASGAARAIT